HVGLALRGQRVPAAPALGRLGLDQPLVLELLQGGIDRPGAGPPHATAALAVPVPPALVLAVLFPCLFVMHGRAPFAPVPAMLIALPEPSLLLLDISTIYRDSHHGKPRPVVVGRSPGRCAIGRAEDAAAGGLLVRVSRRWPTWAGTAAGSRGR